LANKYRGEISGMLDGAEHRLVLTLGALAELEAAFGDQDMVALATRFESGRLSARDCVRVIGCGLRGAGYAISDSEVQNMQADNGAAGFVDIVARLLAATFAGNDQADAHSGGPPPAERACSPPPAERGGGGADAPGPFHGST
jgi:hypothetical protein